MRIAYLLATLVVSLALSGCAGSPESDDDGTAGSADPRSAQTYSVPVLAAHAVTGDARTVTLTVTQDGKELGQGTYDTAGKAGDDFETLFTVEAGAGALKIQAFEGSNPLNFKSIDPARCTDPDFQVHVVDGAVHLWSNCD